MTRVVWVNGVFDVLHLGHVRMLKFAKSLGDYLVVGINSDESVKRLKGPDRPIFTAVERSEMLRGLRDVDDVLIFRDDTPVRAMMSLSRYREIDVVVKGAEYADQDFPERHVFKNVSWHFYDSGISSRTSKLVR